MTAPTSRTLYSLLGEMAAQAPDHPIAMTATEAVTYRQLRDRASALARRLAADGVTRGDRVGLLSPNRIEWLEVLFATAALGATLIPFSTWSKRAELEFLLADSAVKLMFAVPGIGGQGFAEDLAALIDGGQAASLTRVVMIGAPGEEMPAIASRFERYGDLFTASPVAPVADAADARDPIVVLYTSGSSNRPKAVPLCHGSGILNGFGIGERMALTPADRVLVSVPLFWSYGIINALPATITHGATLVLQPRFEPAGALDLIEQRRCTALYTLPAMTTALVAHPEFNRKRTASLRTGLTIGSPQDVVKAAEELGAGQICNIYGSTESYGNCCVTPSTWSLEERSQSQGPPLPGVTLRIREAETGRLLGPGETGELEVTGHLTPGYAGDSARHNAEVFTADGYFRTGDLGSLTPDGRFVYQGRSSEMIKRSGINVSPAEVEEVLQQHPDVGLAGVTGVADPIKGEVIVAYVIPRPGAAAATPALIAHCRERLSSYKIPDHLILSQALPLTPTGKLMRRELKALATETLAKTQGTA